MTRRSQARYSTRNRKYGHRNHRTKPPYNKLPARRTQRRGSDVNAAPAEDDKRLPASSLPTPESELSDAPENDTSAADSGGDIARTGMSTQVQNHEVRRRRRQRGSWIALAVRGLLLQKPQRPGDNTARAASRRLIEGTALARSELYPRDWITGGIHDRKHALYHCANGVSRLSTAARPCESESRAGLS